MEKARLTGLSGEVVPIGAEERAVPGTLGRMPSIIPLEDQRETGEHAA
ncbi:hypothetical protein ACLBWT_14285 [Paenibacillus sp. D51F]